MKKDHGIQILTISMRREIPAADIQQKPHYTEHTTEKSILLQFLYYYASLESEIISET